jgi:hypothetical protein
MRPWISGASFQDDFAGLPELLHPSHAPGLSWPGSSPIADLVFACKKMRGSRTKKTKLSFPAPVKPLFPNCLVTDRCSRIGFEPSRLKYRRICLKPAVSASSQPSETVHMILIFDLFAEAKVTGSGGKRRSPAVGY